MKDFKDYEIELARIAGLNAQHRGCMRMARLHVALLPDSPIGDLTRICKKMFPAEVTPIHPGLWFVASAKIGDYLLNHSRTSCDDQSRRLHELWGDREEI